MLTVRFAQRLLTAVSKPPAGHRYRHSVSAGERTADGTGDGGSEDCSLHTHASRELVAGGGKQARKLPISNDQLPSRLNTSCWELKLGGGSWALEVGSWKLEPNDPPEVQPLHLQVAGVLFDEVLGGNRAISALHANVTPEVERAVDDRSRTSSLRGPRRSGR